MIEVKCYDIDIQKMYGFVTNPERFCLKLEDDTIMVTLKFHDKDITNIIYKAENPLVGIKEVFSDIIKNIEKGNYEIDNWTGSRGINEIVDDDYFELKVDPYLHDMLKSSRRKIKDASGDDLEKKTTQYKALCKIIASDDVSLELTKMKNEPLGCETILQDNS